MLSWEKKHLEHDNVNNMQIPSLLHAQAGKRKLAVSYLVHFLPGKKGLMYHFLH